MKAEVNRLQNPHRYNQSNNSGGDGKEIESKIHCTWDEIEDIIKDLGNQIRKTNKKYDCILGITNGGIIPAKLLARELGIELIQLIPVRNRVLVRSEMPYLYSDKEYLIADDIYDTGNTYRMVSEVTKGLNCDFVFCMSRNDHYYGLASKILNHNKWIVFPWENENLKKDWE